jgi:hypothetical protein
MAIEVRTLVIKAVVQQDQGSGGPAGAGSSAGHNDSKPDEEILNKCLDKITEILKERHER